MSIPQARTAPAPVALRPASDAPAASRARSLAPLRAWLWVVAGCIFAMVVVGGATRLTQSGLSITEWKPVMGALPPLGEAAWAAEFDRYKQIPQYALLNPDMTLSGFKSIYYWEWAHRLLGRIVGSLVLLPLAFFWLTGRLTPALKPRLVGLFLLGGVQGVIGWFMVKSGLSARTDVSQYFLALHLVTASLAFVWAIWLAEGLRRAPAGRQTPALDRLRRTATALVWLVLLQIGLGAFVAGLHAGLVYNTWPLMDGHLVPPLADLARQSPSWSNLFENVTTVQFDHRTVAYAVLILALFHAADAWSGAPRTGVSRRAGLLVAAVLMQAAIGITTLLLVVPLWAALLHQGFAMVVLATAVLHRRRLSAPALRVVRASAGA
ncbi:heme A synthase [Lichenibacterium minor]|uniref:Heme A synthase n=1 Tax=Lichenibacterium minor TaxID=2316528 RepID=A0A4Q2UDK0_9HYPH|nr:COX15/CtaA family protein [Lichenibacterium minor]RYC32905.1 heme A synthase [Lichenibacterium minor]